MAEVRTCFTTFSNSALDVLPETKLLKESKYGRALGPRFFMSCPLSVAVDDKDIVLSARCGEKRIINELSRESCQKPFQMSLPLTLLHR